MDPGQVGGMGQARGPAPGEGLGEIAEIDPAPRDPQGEDEWQTGHRPPGFGEIDHVMERLVGHLHGAVADQQHRVGRALEHRYAQRKLLDHRRTDAVPSIEPNSGQSLTGPRPGV